MKKIVTLLLTAALAVTAETTAFADTEITHGPASSPTPSSGDMDVTYTVKPSYTVTIPGLVTLNVIISAGNMSFYIYFPVTVSVFILSHQILVCARHTALSAFILEITASGIECCFQISVRTIYPQAI